MAAQKIAKLIRLNRLTEIKALHLIADVLPQKVLLRLVFHAFGDNRKTESLAHGDDRIGDDSVIRILGKVADEGSVHLERVDGDVFDLSEGRVSGPEIINGDPHA